MNEANFSGYMNTNNTFIALANNGLTVEKLPAGIYKPNYDWDRQMITFDKIQTNCDEIVDLPSPEYTQVLTDILTFMKPQTKEKFEEYKFIYKRSCLLEGLPGTGKTVVINRIAAEVVKMGGIVLMSPHPAECQFFFDAIDATQPEVLTLVIFEEFDQYFHNGECRDERILSLLDGEIQKSNVMYLATTNYGEEISARFKRPGRFSTVIEMQYPNFEARHAFLKHKLGIDEDIKPWTEQTDGLSIDELKETVLAVKCLGQPLDFVIERIKKTKENVGK